MAYPLHDGHHDRASEHPSTEIRGSQDGNPHLRERDVIALVAQGRKNKQIGEALFISEKTVGHYMTSIFDKLE